MWNTGCNIVYNRTAKRLIHIIDGEDPARILVIPSEGEDTFHGTQVPWADRDAEVTTKAFQVLYYSSTFKKKGWFYIFQDFRTDTVGWADWTSATPYQDGKANAAPFKASYIDIEINVGPDEEGNLVVPVVQFNKVW